MKSDQLYEVVDLRPTPSLYGVCLLQPSSGGMTASFSTGYSQFFPDEDEDDSVLEIEDTRVTLHLDTGDLVFVHLTPDADILAFLNTSDMSLLRFWCLRGR